MKKGFNKGVRPVTIEKAINYFKDVDYHLSVNNNEMSHKDNLKLSHKHNTSFYLLYYAHKKGYYQRVNDGIYIKIKELTFEDVKNLIEYINMNRSKAKATSKTNVSSNKTTYKPSGFKTGVNNEDKFFIVNQSGQIISRPMSVKRAKIIAQRHSENNLGKNFYVCQVILVTGMKYVSTLKEI